MALIPGSRFGIYEIREPLGAGGMGEVYRATDTRLGRDVAIKTLPAGLATDADRLARFEREAKILASLNHAHIAAIYSLDEHDGTRFLAMELVEGTTLDDRLKAGPLLPEDTLSVAVQIAEALEAAHEKGIVHRDLKPANIMVTHDGVVKVLDFGLARAFSNEREGTPAYSPALSVAMTQAGLILGTAAYMSPEQAAGQATDQRADIWAFGVVLYEMLSGQPPFSGESVPHILADVLKAEPDWNRLPGRLHPRLSLLLRHCLRKKPRDRLHSMADARIDIEDVLKDPEGATPDPAARTGTHASARLARVGFGAALFAAGAAAMALGAWMLRPAPALDSAAVVTFTETYPAGTLSLVASDPSIDISRDGRQIMFRRPALGGLYVRAMDTGEARLISGTVGMETGDPTFSPDGNWVVFKGADNQLRRIAMSGGAPLAIASEAYGWGIDWSDDGTILYSRNNEIRRVSENGGDVEVLVSAAGSNERLQQPQEFPVGDWILYVRLLDVDGLLESSEIVLESPSTGERRVIGGAATDVRFVPTGHIVYAFAGVLYAMPFDVDRLEAIGAPVPVVEGVASGRVGLHHFDVSETGILVYMLGAPGTITDLRIAVADSSGSLTAVDTPTGAFGQVRSSPDGQLLAIDSNDPGEGRIIWIHATAGTSAMRRLTFEGNNQYPVWSPDGARIAFQSDRDGDMAIYVQRIDGSGGAQRLTTPGDGEVHIPESWSPDGRFLSFSVLIGDTGTLRILSLDDGSVERFGDFVSVAPIGSVFSPDGEWLAYHATPPGVVQTSSNSGVFVEPFPRTGARFQAPKVARDFQPFWSPDGTAIHFIGSTASNQLVTVDVSAESGLVFGTPRLTPFTLTAGRLSEATRAFDALPDGRFVGPISAAALESGAVSDAAQMRIVLNWFEELRRLAPRE